MYVFISYILFFTARFLLGKNNDFKTATTMLSDHIDWRKTVFPISKQSCLNEFKKGKIFVHGTDKAGHPLVHLTTRFNDPKVRDIEEVGLCLYWWVQYIESHYSNRAIAVNNNNNENKSNTNYGNNGKDSGEMYKTTTSTTTPNDSTKISSSSTNEINTNTSNINYNNDDHTNIHKKVTRFTVLFNRHGADINNVDIEVMKIFSTILQVNYPETLSTAIIHPVNWIFYSVFNIAKFFLDVNTRQKIHPVIDIQGVREFIDDEYIPVELGGTCTYQFNPDDYEDPF